VRCVWRGAGIVTIFLSGTNLQSEINRFRSGSFGFENFISNLLSPASRRDFVGWEEQGCGPCWHYLNSPSSRFVDCSVRALCDHSKACEIEHELEGELGEQVKPRSTIRLGRMYGTKQ